MRYGGLIISNNHLVFVDWLNHQVYVIRTRISALVIRYAYISGLLFTHIDLSPFSIIPQNMCELACSQSHRHVNGRNLQKGAQVCSASVMRKRWPCFLGVFLGEG